MKSIPYGRQTIDEKDIVAVTRVMRSAHLTQGPEITAFERALANYCGVRYAIAVSSGTAALHLAYLTASFKKGDEVITTPNTFVATANMLLAVGVKPVFSDIRLDSYNFDESQLEKLVTNKTRAIVPVHFAGHPCDMEKIWQLARKRKLVVIEDASHALGAKYGGKKIGAGRSDMTVTSFHPVKSITTGEGGAVLTNNKSYYKKLLLLRSHGIKKDKKGFNVMTELGYNFRLTDLQAALGKSQLERLDQFIKNRRRIAKWYQAELKDSQDTVLPTELSGSYSSWHIYVIRVLNPKMRDPLSVYLKKSGIGVNFHYPAVYAQPYYRKHGYRRVKIFNMDLYHRTCLTLPIFPNLARTEVKFVADRIKKFFNQKR